VNIKYPEVGVCGLSCRLCPSYHSDSESRCGGCKSESRMKVGCPFITCAVKKRGIEYCGDCSDNLSCGKWRQHREHGRSHDSFVCYQRLEDNIAFIEDHGISSFDRIQKERQELLSMMLGDFNEGRSKTYYAIAATVMDIQEIRDALSQAAYAPSISDRKSKSKILHEILDKIADEKGYLLKLRKKPT
jgi:hypothetical protein